MEKATPLYLDVLRTELERRLSNNPRYSLRAFARALDVDPAVLSRSLTGKRGLSRAVGERMAGNLKLSPVERTHFLNSIAEEKKRNFLEKCEMPTNTSLGWEAIEADQFAVIADLYHYAILELACVKGFKPNIHYIAKRLGLTSMQARFGVERLMRLGLLEKRNGTWCKSKRNIGTADKNITTPALKRHQRQILEKAIAAIDSQALSIRNMTGMTMAIDPKRIPVAKKMIQEFSEALCSYLEQGERTEVYQLGISLFSLGEDK